MRLLEIIDIESFMFTWPIKAKLLIFNLSENN